MARAAQARAATAQTIEAYVGETMDNARMGRLHWQVLALVASGYFFDVMDFTIFGALVPDLIKSGFVTQSQVPWIGSATLAGLFIGTLGQGEFTDRFGRKAVYQFNLLLFGLATIVAALPPIPSIGFDPGLWWLIVFRFIAGVGLGAEQPLCFSYTAEYAPKNIRGRLTAFMQFIGGAWPWPVGVLLAITLRDSIGWRGIWIIIGIGALIIFVLRFSLPESPRWLATHGQGQRALDILQRMGLRTVPLASLSVGAASDTKSDPIALVHRDGSRSQGRPADPVARGRAGRHRMARRRLPIPRRDAGAALDRSRGRAWHEGCHRRADGRREIDDARAAATLF
jgi:MFS transporter, putative metabolite:H+ symporter